MVRVKIAKTKFSFVRRALGLGNAASLRKQRRGIQETPAEPELIWVRLVTEKEHRMTAVPVPE